MKEASYHLTLLAQNRTGFQNLLKLASAAFLEGFYFRPRIDKELLEAHNEGLICLSGCALQRAQPGAGRPAARPTWPEGRRDRRLVPATSSATATSSRSRTTAWRSSGRSWQGAVEVARRMGIPLVATSDVHYVDREDAEAQDILLCVNTGKFRTDTNRMRMETNEFYLRSPEEMYAAFRRPARTRSGGRQEIADGVDIELELGKRHFPGLHAAGRKDLGRLPARAVPGGAQASATQDRPDRCADGQLSEEVIERLDRELGVINKLGFPNYFLIVWDFVRFAREQGIEATARGSGVGSLVSYALYLSHVCPLEYDLLFERFLDESRLEAPDIDIDFCQQRRGEVIQYVKDKYGVENVAQIGTFGTLAARAAIRDVGRALGLPIPRVDAVVAMVPERAGHHAARRPCEKSDDLQKAYETDGEVRELLDLAMQIEGLARNVGTHAAAVVIADRPLTDYVPLQQRAGQGGNHHPVGDGRRRAGRAC